MIVGLIITFESPFFYLIALFFMSEKLAMALFFCCCSLGFIILTLSLAKRRIEEGKVEAEDILHALTPAQISLIVSLILFAAGGTIGAFGSSTFAGVLFILAGIGIFVSIIFVFVRPEKRKPKPEANVAASKVPYTPASTYRIDAPGKAPDLIRKNAPGKDPDLIRKNAPANVVCAKCGTSMANDGTVRHMGEKYYCKTCYEKMAKDLIQLEEERKRLELKRVYFAECSSCGVEHPKSEFHMVDGKYYCEECFNRMFAFESNAAANPVNRKQFDSDAFAMNHKSVISPYLPKDIEDTDTQKCLLENLDRVLPMDLKTAVEAGDLNKNARIGMNAQKVDERLKALNMDAPAANLKSSTDDQLINAYILLDYYAFVLKPESSEGIREARAYIGLELDQRLP